MKRKRSRILRLGLPALLTALVLLAGIIYGCGTSKPQNAGDDPGVEAGPRVDQPCIEGTTRSCHRGVSAIGDLTATS